MWDKIVLSGFADEIDPSLDEQIRVLKKLGMNHIEMRGVNGKGLVEYTLEEAKEIKKRLQRALPFLPLALRSVRSKSPMISSLIWNYTNTP